VVKGENEKYRIPASLGRRPPGISFGAPRGISICKNSPLEWYLTVKIA